MIAQSTNSIGVAGAGPKGSPGCETARTSQSPQAGDPVALPVSATRNACKLCTPLGACLAFAGIEGARTILHGSQGCATYIRRYMISHFKEPIDIASSSFGESSAVYGGRENLRLGLANVARQYQPQLIGIATTCLAETIGDDVGMFLREIAAEPSAAAENRPVVVHVSTPSYSGTHAEGYYAAVRAVVEQLAEGGPHGDHVNLFPAMFSPADIRYLKEIFEDFALPATILPDYSDTLDGPLYCKGATTCFSGKKRATNGSGPHQSTGSSYLIGGPAAQWDDYQLIPAGGTPLKAVRDAGRARASIEFSFTNDAQKTAAALLAERFEVPNHRLGLPIGVTQTDKLFETLTELTGLPTPTRHSLERGRLLDSFVDAHKCVFGKRAAVFGEEDLVVGIVSLLAEIGVVPALCVSGGKSGRLRQAIVSAAGDLASEIDVRDGVDFAQLDEVIAGKEIDLLIGSSKGYSLARRLEVPLVRVGFPIHDRIGGARLLHVGYRGAQQLFDRIANTLIDEAQKKSPVGYTYM